MVQPAVGQGAVRVIQRGMYSDTGGLFQHGGELVLVGNGKRDGLRRDAGGRFRRQCKGDLLAGMHRLVGVERGSIGEKAIAIIFDGFDQGGGDALCAQEDPQPLTVRLGRDDITQNGQKQALPCGILQSMRATRTLIL